MKEIQLTQGKVALVDDDDFDYLSQWKWYAHKPSTRDIYYAVRNRRKIEGVGSKRVYMHRDILGVIEPTTLIDHWDTNGLNNCKYNLRQTNKSGNQCNCRPKINKLYSNYKGVSFRKDTNKFVSHIHINDIQIGLGCFLTDVEAAIAYDNAALIAFGKFAKLNFPERGV
jgi:hypothetical protein